ncbi:unnamed protein product [Rhizoctonia solani]|uniref:Ricin B lectin domain-containing protein n=1 Tax=Rhizoctonia solani TaxID=456999 RepID=A0A8H3HFX2_9AGAM|nr:unnamed protein product [Rhizoctonia solani]
MGQAQTSSVWDSYAPNCDITPGTYRIVHDGTDKTLQIHTENKHMVILQSPLEEEKDHNDHWFILRSGDGFIFKHGREKMYLTGSWSSISGPQPVRATRYPTTWTIHTKKGSDNKCVIMVGGENWNEGECFGLVGKASQRGVCFARLLETEEHDQIWRIERIGDATIEEDPMHRIQALERELEAANARWTVGEPALRAMLHQLDTKEAKLETIQSELGKQALELDVVRDELRQQAAELRQKYQALDEIRELLDAKERAISEKDRSMSGNGIINEKGEDVAQGQDGLEADSDEQSELTVWEDTNDISMPDVSIRRPVSKLTSKLETQIQSVESPPTSAPVDERLAELGWNFD